MATFTNQAQITYNGTTLSSNVVTGEITEVLSAAKNAVSDVYSRGDSATFVISIVNSGSIPYTNLTVTDNLGAYTFGEPPQELYPFTYEDGTVRYYINGVEQTAPAVSAGPPLVFTGISVPANGNAIIIFSARPNEYAPLDAGAGITNVATISGGGLTAPITVTAAVDAAEGADLAITKALSPSVIVENGQLTYTFTIENYGNTAVLATDDVVLTDTFDPILNPISVSFNGVTWTTPENYTYSTETGVFSTVSGNITVPAATFTQDAETGVITVTPGISTLTVTGTV